MAQKKHLPSISDKEQRSTSSQRERAETRRSDQAREGDCGSDRGQRHNQKVRSKSRQIAPRLRRASGTGPLRLVRRCFAG